MRELLLILRRELLERVRSKSFLLSTILTPVFFLLFALGPGVSDALTGDERMFLAVVDESREGFGEALASALSSAPEGVGESRLHVQVVRAPLAQVRDSLTREVVAERLDGFVRVPAGVAAGEPIEYRARTLADGSVRRIIAQTATVLVQAERLRSAGLEPELLAALLTPVRVEAARVTSEAAADGSGEAGMLFSVLVGFALYLLILLYGVQVLQSVQEEKTNRIAEILVSSVSASHLMIGKVFGVGLAALLQITVWAALAWALSGTLQDLLGGSLPASELGEMLARVEPGLIALVLLYLLLGFFLYATLFAAAGAAAASTEDAQRFTFPLIMPLIVPMMLMSSIVSDPLGTVAVTLSWIPFTLPLAMPMRIGAGGAAPGEIAGSLLVLAASVAVLGVLAGKIYRMGILSTGKRPTLAELARWLRTA